MNTPRDIPASLLAALITSLGASALVALTGAPVHMIGQVAIVAAALTAVGLLVRDGLLYAADLVWGLAEKKS